MPAISVLRLLRLALGRPGAYTKPPIEASYSMAIREMGRLAKRALSNALAASVD